MVARKRCGKRPCASRVAEGAVRGRALDRDMVMALPVLALTRLRAGKQAPSVLGAARGRGGYEDERRREDEVLYARCV